MLNISTMKLKERIEGEGNKEESASELFVEENTTLNDNLSLEDMIKELEYGEGDDNSDEGNSEEDHEEDNDDKKQSSNRSLLLIIC